MRVTEERIRRLAAVGLTEGQARAYLALLDLGAASAAEAARATGLPRTRLYPLFQELQAIGLADALPGEPQRHAPRSLEPFLRRRLDALQAERQRLALDVPHLLREFPVPSEGSAEADGATRVFRGRRAALLHVQEAFEAARETLVIGATPGTLARLAAAGLDAVLALRLAEGLAVELLLPPGVDDGAAERLLGPGSGVVARRVAGGLPMEVLLADGRRAVAYAPRPDDRSATRGDDEGLASASRAVVGLFAGALAGHASGAPWTALPSVAAGLRGGLVVPDQTTQR